MATTIQPDRGSRQVESIAEGTGSPLGVCVFRKPAPNRAQPVNYPDYLFEILTHAGVCHAVVDQDRLGQSLDEIKLLVTVGDHDLEPSLRQKLTGWVQAGGAWLSIGGTCGMNEVLGVEYAPSSYANWGAGAVLHGEGYLIPRDSQHPAVAHLQRGLHFFGGLALKSAGASVIAGSVDSHQRGEGLEVLFERTFGAGRAMTLSVDVTGTIVRIQQGIAVTRDGVCAPDGTAPVADGVLKSGDGAVLDWTFDRVAVNGVPGLKIFAEPIADLWRELVLRSVLHLAVEQRVVLPVLWLYPRALPAIAHMSHDSDGNDPARARELLSLLSQADIRSTWCIILPGYDQPLMSMIRAAGHEFATHYDAMTGSGNLVWGEAQFATQHEQLSALFGHKPVTNKNHYLRWEGDAEFFDWCARQGIEMDQSKGPSKTGEAGFNFGTCHPYLPVTFDNRYIDVIELPTLTQDLVIFAPPAILEPLLAATLRVHGVLHLLFHPAHVGKPNVNEAFLHSIEAAKAMGMEWWTAEQLNRWERARRSVRWSNYGRDGRNVHVNLCCGADLEDATVLWLCAERPGIDGESVPAARFRAWGFSFTASTHSMSAGRAHVLTADCTKAVMEQSHATAM